jgi:hypothetical protein
MKKIFGFIAALFLLALVIPVTAARAAGPLDEIKNYTITIDPRSDGTLDIKYHIDWLVLDSTSEGPLSWVKVGIPNRHADDIKALSATIKSIGYMEDSGSYVRVDLDREYTAGETVSFDFSLHQSYLYRLDTANNVCSYSFVPGWFDGITVDSFKLLWNKRDITYSDSTGTEGNYVTWSKELLPGERLTVIVRYSGSTFATSQDMQATDDNNAYTYSNSDAGDSSGGIVIVIVVVVIVFIIIGAAGGGGRYRGGFGGRGGGIFISGGGHGGGGGCACACAGCACACACAGGGRAGCSAKNFYGAVVETEKLKRALSEGNLRTHA